MINKIRGAVFAFISALILSAVPLQAGLNIKANVIRLSELAKEKESKTDTGFMEAISLIDRSVEDKAVPREVQRMISSRKFSYSRYMPALLYFMAANTYDDAGSLNFWFEQMRNYNDSVFFFPTQLIRLDRMKVTDQSRYPGEVAVTVGWLKSVPDTFNLIGPDFKGNMVWGIKPRMDFREGDLPNQIKKSDYIRSVAPLSGFNETNSYIALLEVNRADNGTLEEIARTYLRNGDSKKASAAFFEIAGRKNSLRDFVGAKNFYQRALSLDPKNSEIATALDKVKLELVYVDNPEEGSVAQTATNIPSPASTTPKESQRIGVITANNVNLRAEPSTLSAALDRVSAPQRVEILEIYMADNTSEGIIRGDAVLVTDDGEKIPLQNGKAVFIVSDIGDNMVVAVTTDDSKKYTGRVPADRISKTAGGKWYKVQANKRVGWVFGDFLDEKSGK
jgi:hypothetical protein